MSTFPSKGAWGLSTHKYSRYSVPMQKYRAEAGARRRNSGGLTALQRNTCRNTGPRLGHGGVTPEALLRYSEHMQKCRAEAGAWRRNSGGLTALQRTQAEIPRQGRGTET